MKNQINQLFFSLGLLFTLLQMPDRLKAQDNIFKKSDAYVKEMMDNLEIVGLNYAVLKNGKVIHQKAMGLANIEHQVPMSRDKLFAVASISKLFSSIALHQLLEIKNRRVEETVGDFLPERLDLPNAWKKLSLKQLLSHTSGIPDQIDYQIYLAPESDAFVISGMKDKPFTSKPGTKSRYNATGFLLVRLIIEKLAGQDFESYMQTQFFDKFGLTTANYGGFKKVVPQRVTTYRNMGGNLEIFPLSYSSPMYAAAGLNISLADLMLWLQQVLNGKIISKEHLKTVWTPVSLENGSPGYFGLGWEAYALGGGIWMCGHGGAGISSIRHYWKENSSETLSVIFLSNGAKNWQKRPNQINQKIADFFMDG
ncbi:MAG: serine hydrolase domain-containing protein, partial [Bacteroidota bacterium]